jgi:hypothetical protein
LRHESIRSDSLDEEILPMSVYVKFPDALLVASREEREVFSRNVLIYTLGHLYAELHHRAPG